ncbi:19673_t:CDS:2, partial [Funneliformis geosporum]
EALIQYKKLADYFGLPLIPSPSGGYHLQHRRIKGQEAINGSKLYYCAKSTNYNFESVGEPRGKGQGVVHPLSKDRLPELTEENKIYAKFGFYFSNQLPRKEKKENERPIIRDSRNDLTDTSIAIVNCKHLAEQKTTNYNPYQINFLTEPFGEKKQLILNASHPYQQKLLTNFLKSDGSLFQFKLLQLSLDCHLQRWKSAKESKSQLEIQSLPIIPKKEEGAKWQMEVSQSRYGKQLDLENGTFQQIILTGKDKQDYSVLFNPESNGLMEPFLDRNIGNFANTFYLKAGNINCRRISIDPADKGNMGICLNIYAEEMVIEMGNYYYKGCNCNADLQNFRKKLVDYAEKRGHREKLEKEWGQKLTEDE